MARLIVQTFLGFALAAIIVDPVIALSLQHEQATPDFNPNEVKRLFSGTLDFQQLLLKNANTEEPYDDVHRSSMLEGCGEICDSTIMGTKGIFFNTVRKNVDCTALYANDKNDAPAQMWPPPKEIPSSMLQDFTFNQTLSVQKWYLKIEYSGNADHELVWSEQLIQESIDQAKAGTLYGTYGPQVTTRVRNLLQKHQDSIKGKRFFTIGSETPWLEALLLESGAEHVTTIEYGRIRSEDPRVSAVLPSEMRKMYLESSTKPQFDGGATFSSLEHSGLGRYGDTVNPWGDLQAMAKAWCITKNAGPMFVGVPTGNEHVKWNAHRVYGKKRWSQLMANWEQRDKDSQESDEMFGVMHYFTKLP